MFVIKYRHLFYKHRYIYFINIGTSYDFYFKNETRIFILTKICLIKKLYIALAISVFCFFYKFILL